MDIISLHVVETKKGKVAWALTKVGLVWIVHLLGPSPKKVLSGLYTLSQTLLIVLFRYLQAEKLTEYQFWALSFELSTTTNRN